MFFRSILKGKDPLVSACMPEEIRAPFTSPSFPTTLLITASEEECKEICRIGEADDQPLRRTTTEPLSGGCRLVGWEKAVASTGALLVSGPSFGCSTFTIRWVN